MKEKLKLSTNLKVNTSPLSNLRPWYGNVDSILIQFLYFAVDIYAHLTFLDFQCICTLFTAQATFLK